MKEIRNIVSDKFEQLLTAKDDYSKADLLLVNAEMDAEKEFCEYLINFFVGRNGLPLSKEKAVLIVCGEKSYKVWLRFSANFDIVGETE